MSTVERALVFASGLCEKQVYEVSTYVRDNARLKCKIRMTDETTLDTVIKICNSRFVKRINIVMDIRAWQLGYIAEKIDTRSIESIGLYVGYSGPYEPESNEQCSESTDDVDAKEDTMDMILSRFPNLNELHIGKVNPIDFQGGAQLYSVRDLVVRGCYIGDDDILSKIPLDTLFPNLKVMWVHGANALSMVSSGDLFPAKLEELSLYDINSLWDRDCEDAYVFDCGYEEQLDEGEEIYIEKLPTSLKKLCIAHPAAIESDSLPQGLHTLGISGGYDDLLHVCPVKGYTVPKNLKCLSYDSVSDCELDLPDTLETLHLTEWCNEELINPLPTLPLFLKTLHYDGNLIRDEEQDGFQTFPKSLIDVKISGVYKGPKLV
jgi:hypothetical protein